MKNKQKTLNKSGWRYFGRLAAVCLMLSVCVMPCMGQSGSSERESLRLQAVETLEEAFESSALWTQIHAAEFLLAYDKHREKITEQFEALQATAAPKDRIGVWRVLAHAVDNDTKARKHHMQAIVDAWRDSESPDRDHAIKSLGKLGYADQHPTIIAAAQSNHSRSASACWVLANSGNPQDQIALAALLYSSDSATRGMAAYALRHLPVLSQKTLDTLRMAFEKEPSNSSSRIYLLSCLYVHSPAKGREALHHKLLMYFKASSQDDRRELCLALSVRGDLNDVPVLVTLMSDQSLDVRAHAAHALLRIDRRNLRGLHTADWAVVICYFSAMILLGWYYSTKQHSTEDYFLAGRKTRSFVAGISLYATLLSTISYLASPGEMIKYGPGVLAGIIAAPIVYLICGYVLIPVLLRRQVTSVYELLGHRLGPGVRLTASIVFIVTRLVWMALLAYLASNALVVMLGWSPAAVPYVVIAIGLIAVIYTALGGISVVMVTDVVQFFILIGGAILTIGYITYLLGGVENWIPTQWASHWEDQPLFSWDPTVRVTLVGSMIAYIAWWLCTACSDQVVIQRYLATGSIKVARRAFLFSMVAEVTVGMLLGMTGFALLAFFTNHPQLIPDGQTLISNADNLFPHFIANVLPWGVAGLVISAMLAAAMSSLDSGINSITTVYCVDILGRSTKPAQSEKQLLRTARYLSLGIGVVVVLVSSIMFMVPGNITAVTTKTNGLFVGPLAGLVLTALFFKRATPFATLLGALCGLIIAALIAFWDVITDRPGLSFLYIIPASLIVHVIVMITISAAIPPRLKSM